MILPPLFDFSPRRKGCALFPAVSVWLLYHIYGGFVKTFCELLCLNRINFCSPAPSPEKVQEIFPAEPAYPRNNLTNHRLSAIIVSSIPMQTPMPNPKNEIQQSKTTCGERGSGPRELAPLLLRSWIIQIQPHMELQVLYPVKSIPKVFAELFSKSDPFPLT